MGNSKKINHTQLNFRYTLLSAVIEKCAEKNFDILLKSLLHELYV